MELEILKTYIETHLKTGFIQPSKSLAGTPILFDKKPNGSFHLCVNHWDLNNLTIKNRYPLPLIGEALDCLGQAEWFTQLDLTSTYHRMRIREGDDWKTTFRTKYSHFEYQVMPFGLSNVPASFQGYLNKILAKKLDIFVVVYLDDILIYIEDPGQPHVNAVWSVLKQLQKYGHYANLKKYRFHEDEVRFLGFVVSAQGIRIEEKKIKAVRDWPKPQSVRDIQVFLGFANFYRRFIRNFSKIAIPPTSMLWTINNSTRDETQSTQAENQDAPVAACRAVGGGVGGSFENLLTTVKSAESKKPKLTKSQKSDLAKANSGTDFLTLEAKKGFIHLQKAFTEAPILRHFDSKCHIRIETDTSGYAISEVLSQMTFDHSDQLSSKYMTHENLNPIFSKSEIGQWHLVAFFSRKMIPAETRYKTHN